MDISLYKGEEQLDKIEKKRKEDEKKTTPNKKKKKDDSDAAATEPSQDKAPGPATPDKEEKKERGRRN